VACDGLWDVMNDQEVADVVSKQRTEGKNAEDVAKFLVDLAKEKGSKDNISVIVIFLP